MKNVLKNHHVSRCCVLYFTAAILAALPAAAGGEGTRIVAKPDHLLLVAGTDLSFEVPDLLANDDFINATFDLVELPDRGQLVGNAITGYTYRPENGSWGRDVFTYSMTSGEETVLATVTLHVAPERSPLAGHWSTADNVGPTGGSMEGHSGVDLGQPGFGEELGWWNHRLGLLVLCDWDDGWARDCATAAPEGSAEDYAAWMPFMMDLDFETDGDELLLYDPSTGDLQIFLIRQTGPLPAPFSLEPLPYLVLHGEAGDFWLAGSWTSRSDQLGRYSLTESGVFYLEGPDETQVIVFYQPEWRPLPMAGDWLGRGLDQIGIFDTVTAKLWVSETSQSAQPLPFDTAYLRFAGPIFSGRITYDDSASFLGSLNWQEGNFVLVSFSGFLWGENHLLGPLPIEVLIDPPSPS